MEDLEQMDIVHLIPSHSNPESKFDKTALSFTKAYLEKTIQVESESADSAAFMAAMNQAFPNLPNQGVLGLSAKVVMQEMPWG